MNLIICGWWFMVIYTFCPFLYPLLSHFTLNNHDTSYFDWKQSTYFYSLVIFLSFYMWLWGMLVQLVVRWVSYHRVVSLNCSRAMFLKKFTLSHSTQEKMSIWLLMIALYFSLKIIIALQRLQCLVFFAVSHGKLFNLLPVVRQI